MARQSQDGALVRPLFRDGPFTGFGPSRFRVDGEAVVAGVIRGGRPARLRGGVREYAPRVPGVYAMLDPRGRLLYVGKAKSLRTRLLSYFRGKSRDPKAGRIVSQTRWLLWEQCADEFAALLRELELIQRHRPRLNVQGQPGYRRYHYVCVGRPPASYVFLTSEPTGQEQALFGPLAVRSRAEEAVRRLNDWFQLRDCPSTTPIVFAEQPELFPAERAAACLRGELGNCLAPCAGACSRKAYAAQVQAARAFLEGQDLSPLQKLTRMMQQAAEEFQFERASAIRDRLQALQWLADRLALLRKARQGPAFVYPLTGHDGQQRWYLIQHGEVCGVVLAPRPGGQGRELRPLLERVFREGAWAEGVAPRRADSILLVASWFRRHPEERKRLLSRRQALACCQGPPGG